MGRGAEVAEASRHERLVPIDRSTAEENRGSYAGSTGKTDAREKVDNQLLSPASASAILCCTLETDLMNGVFQIPETDLKMELRS